MTRLAALFLVALLAACVTGADEPRPREASDVLHYTVGESGGAGKRLIPYTTLSGFLSVSGAGRSKFIRVVAGLDERESSVRRPAALGAGERGVYVIDGDTNALYRFRWPGDDTGQKPEFKRLGALGGMSEPGDLFVAPNGDIYVSDSKARKVVRFDAEGRELQVFEDAENLNQPVSVTIDSRGLRVFVADGLYDRVVVFNPEGQSLYGIGYRGDGPGGFKNIRSMVQGRNGILYVVNGMRQQIQAYGLDGLYMGSFGQGTFSDADGIAVDDDNRIYLADRFNHRIVIYHDGKLVESYGQHGTRAGEFNQPGRLAYHKGMLYVADRENGRIQAFKVVPEKMLHLKEAGK